MDEFDKRNPEVEKEKLDKQQDLAASILLTESTGSLTEYFSQSEEKKKTEEKEKKKLKRNRCYECRKKCGLANGFECKCGYLFCVKHRYAEDHGCKYDYRGEGASLLKKNNEVVRGVKLDKI
jgi:predicted nucleic acid binding AN1-type Zn finger protein